MCERHTIFNIKLISLSGRHLKKKPSLHKWSFPLLIILTLSVLSMFLLMKTIQRYPYCNYQPDSQLQFKLQEILNNRNSREEVYYSLREAWAYLSPNYYEELTTEERLAVAELIADFEAEQLGIPTVKLKVAQLEEGIVSLYDNSRQTVIISDSLLEESNPDLLIESVAHEMFHSGQWFCVESTDWNSPITKTWYFKEISEWKSNFNEYKSTSAGYSYYQYVFQPVEMSARAYSSKEKDQILLHVYVEGD